VNRFHGVGDWRQIHICPVSAGGNCAGERLTIRTAERGHGEPRIETVEQKIQIVDRDSGLHMDEMPVALDFGPEIILQREWNHSIRRRHILACEICVQRGEIHQMCYRFIDRCVAVGPSAAHGFYCTTGAFDFLNCRGDLLNVDGSENGWDQDLAGSGPILEELSEDFNARTTVSRAGHS
jgi:hypothetical protein